MGEKAKKLQPKIQDQSGRSETSEKSHNPNPEFAFWEEIISGNLISVTSRKPTEYSINFAGIENKLRATDFLFTGEEKLPESSDEVFEEIGSMAKEIFPKAFDSLEAAGVLNEPVKTQVQRLLTVNDVVAGWWPAVAQFLYNHKSFPQVPNDRAQLVFGHRFLNHEHAISQGLSSRGVLLKPEDLRKIVIWTLNSHEGGHAIERAIQLRLVEKQMMGKLHEELPSIFHRISKDMEEEVTFGLGADSQLQSLLDDKESKDEDDEEISLGGMVFIKLRITELNSLI